MGVDVETRAAPDKPAPDERDAVLPPETRMARAA